MEDFKLHHWALLDLQYTYLDDGFTLVATTDVPCHLFCRMTTTPPRKHSLPSMRRGLRITGDIRFCFVVYEDNEQAEPGDTLIHTFVKPGWPVGERRWFYFVGKINNTDSPSETAIFEFHFPAPPPEPPPLVDSTLYPVFDGDFSQLLRFPDEPISHWDKVRYSDDNKYVWWRFGVLRFDTFLFSDPPKWAYKHTVQGIVVRVRKRQYNPLAWHKIRIIQDGITWDSAQIAGYTPNWTWIDWPLPLNPITGLPWTYAELIVLQAGIGMFDSGIPSQIHCDAYEVVITWNPPS
ncbi:hypothetical protein ES703_35265 [subsurface metagenome]